MNDVVTIECSKCSRALATLTVILKAKFTIVQPINAVCEDCKDEKKEIFCRIDPFDHSGDFLPMP